MKKVLIVSNDIVDENMGGVGVRYWEIAHSLAQNCLVTLAVPNETKLVSATVEVVSFDLQHGDLSDLARKADVIIVQGFILHFHPYLRDLGIPIAVDLYVPSLLEGLVWHDQDDWNSWIPAYEEYLRVQLELLRAGDFFFCASERQRDYWLGWLHAQKRINPHTYRDDPSLRKLIDVVPFGLPDNRPPEHKPVLKGIHPGIPEDSFLLLWGGGLWDWLDPLTLIRAVALLIPHHPELRLFFMGTRHPDAVVSGMKMADQAIALSQQLGLFNQNIFFNDWVPYNERINYLQEADLGVVTHLEQIETHFSFRTRILDCIWVGLPIVTTQGDSLAEEVVKANIGLSVPPGDVSALAQAIETFITRGRGAIGQNAWENIRGKFGWKNVVGPLLNFCERPCAAPDKTFYLTETERISRGKDEFLQKVIHDKDDFLQKVIRAKDEFFNQALEQKEQTYQMAATITENEYQQRISQKERMIEELTEQRGRLQMALVQYEQHKIIRLYKHLFMGKKDLMIGDLIASIVIVNFNGKHFLPACLNAIVAQTLPKDAYEVIVSDNGSTDRSLEMLKQEYPWVRVIENGKNLGFAAGNNVAFKAARGKYLVAVNNDTAPLPDWLEKLIKAAEENPRAGIINGHSCLFYDQLILKLESENFVPESLDTRLLGVMVSMVESGADRGVVQYLEGFYSWEEFAGLRYRWTNGNATLGIPVPSGLGEWSLKLKLSAPRPNDIPVHVFLKIGDELLGEWDVSGIAPQVCEIFMPAVTRQLAEPLVQNAGSNMDQEGYGRDRGTYANNNEMFFEIDRAQYQSENIFTACGANILLKREMLAEIGGFDARFFMYYEDADLSWRAWLGGWEVYYTNTAIIRHIHSGSSKEWSPFFLFHTSRNRLAMLLKNGNSRQIFRNWGRFILGTGRNTFGFLKAILRRNPDYRAIWAQLKIRYRVVLSLMIWLPILIWQRIIIHHKQRTASAEIEKWLTTHE